MLACSSTVDTQHVNPHLEVRDDIVLNRLIVEGIHQDFVTVTLVDGIRNASDETEELVGKVFVEVGLEASLVENVGE
jgi:hypothetical protein